MARTPHLRTTPDDGQHDEAIGRGTLFTLLKSDSAIIFDARIFAVFRASIDAELIARKTNTPKIFSPSVSTPARRAHAYAA